MFSFCSHEVKQAVPAEAGILVAPAIAGAAALRQ
jgi:hypothetical protein